MLKLNEFTTPRYFFILPVHPGHSVSVGNEQNLLKCYYKLYFLCEASHEPEKMHVPSFEDGYIVKDLKNFIKTYGFYLSTTLALGRILPKSDHYDDDDLKQRLDTAEALLKYMNANTVHSSSAYQQGQGLTEFDLHELEQYLEVDNDTDTLGKLHRMITAEGHVRWLCSKHYDHIHIDSDIRMRIRELERSGVKFIQDNRQSIIIKRNITKEDVGALCEALRKGLNISRIVFEDCSFQERDLDKLFDIVINRSPIRCVRMVRIDITVTNRRLWRTSYKCKNLNITFTNHLLKARFGDDNHEGNTKTLACLLRQNKTYRKLDLSAHEFLRHEDDLRQLLPSSSLTTLIAEYVNNNEFLNALFTTGMNNLRRLKLNKSLQVPSARSLFCELLQKNQTLVELDLMDDIGIEDESFINNLFGLLRGHRSIQCLCLHIVDLQPSTPKEKCLIDSLHQDRFLTRLRISKTSGSPTLIQAVIDAAQERRTLTHLELYEAQWNTDHVSQLHSLYNDGHLAQLIVTEQLRLGTHSEQLISKSISTRFYSICASSLEP